MVLETSSNCNCHPDADPQGEKGTTVWGECAPISFTINPGYDHVVSFTDTKPQCYIGGTHTCLITYKVTINQTSGNQEVRINKFFNNQDINPCYHSKTQGHDITEVIDLPPFGFYNDGQLNTLRFANVSDVTVTINNFRIFRAYGMQNLFDDCHGYCTDPADVAPNGSADWTREDYPCNYENGGTRVSFARFGPDSSQGDTVSPGQSKTWIIQNPSATPSNYDGPYAFFFNLNNVDVEGNTPNLDVHYSVTLNGHTIADFYHSKNGQQTQHAGIDLVKSGYLNDNPGMLNTLVLHNHDQYATLRLLDGIDDQPPDPGRIDFYRFWKVKTLWQDDFNDNERNSCLWDALSNNGGSTNESGGQLEVTIPGGGSGWAQAGYVSRVPIDHKEMTTTVQVYNLDQLDEMILQIGNTKTTSQDPEGQPNWYRILKSKPDQMLYVQSRINQTKTTKVYPNWASATGPLKISASTGAIAFYENNIMRYSEPFALPSSNCYTYIYTSTNRERSSGTDEFDNFSINTTSTTATTTAFRDDFNDNDYNDKWTVTQGSWTASNKKLTAQQSWSLIRTNQQFSSNRHVRVQTRTLTAGTDPWNVGYVMVKYLNDSNKVYCLIHHTNGNIELAIVKNGVKNMLWGNSQLSPYTTHAFDVSIIGTTVRVWIDGQLYIEETHDWLDDFGGYAGFYTDQNSTAEFDDLIIFDE